MALTQESLRSFWQAHSEAVIAAALTLIVTLAAGSLKSLVKAMIGGIVRAGARVSRRLERRALVGAYLNWVVLSNQELNLTGIIATGPKPHLEQVFISLSLTSDRRPSVMAARKPHVFGIRGRIAEWLVSRARDRTPPLPPPGELPALPATLSFKRYWRVREIKGRFAHYLIIAMFIAIPGLIIFDQFAWIFRDIRLDHSESNLMERGARFALMGLLLYPPVHFVSRHSGRHRNESVGVLELAVAATLAGEAALMLGVRVGKGDSILLSTSLMLIGFLASVLFMRRGIVRRRTALADTPEHISYILRRDNRVAILGKPGSGKSTLLQYVALSYARKRASDRKLRSSKTRANAIGTGRWYMPILVPLRRVAGGISRHDALGTHNSLLDVWRDSVLPSDLRGICSPRILGLLLKRGKCLLLLDGLDEVADEAEWRHVVNEVRGIGIRYPECPILISSRTAGWRGGIGSEFSEYHVADLRQAQVSRFVTAWYKSIEQNSDTQMTMTQRVFLGRRAAERASELLSALRSNASMRHLTENPLLLSMMCFVHYSQALPKERASLYRECSRLLLLQWDLEKGINVDDTDLSYGQKELIMQELAFAFHSGQLDTGLGRREAEHDGVMEVIRRKLREFRLPEGRAEALLQKLIVRSGLVVGGDLASSGYRFSHLTFQEYFAAKHIVERRLEFMDALVDSSPDSIVTWWREVALLYVSMITDASEFIKRILGEGQVDTRILYIRRLQLAAQCVQQAITVRDEEIEQALLSKLAAVRNVPQEGCPGATDEQVRSYLLGFAASSDFYKYALEFMSKEAEHQARLPSLTSTLLEGVSDSDANLAVSCARALAKLLEERPDLIGPEITGAIESMLQDERRGVSVEAAALLVQTQSLEDGDLLRKLFCIAFGLDIDRDASTATVSAGGMGQVTSVPEMDRWACNVAMDVCNVLIKSQASIKEHAEWFRARLDEVSVYVGTLRNRSSGSDSWLGVESTVVATRIAMAPDYDRVELLRQLRLALTSDSHYHQVLAVLTCIVLEYHGIDSRVEWPRYFVRMMDAVDPFVLRREVMSFCSTKIRGSKYSGNLGRALVKRLRGLTFANRVVGSIRAVWLPVRFATPLVYDDLWRIASTIDFFAPDHSAGGRRIVRAEVLRDISNRAMSSVIIDGIYVWGWLLGDAESEDEDFFMTLFDSVKDPEDGRVAAFVREGVLHMLSSVVARMSDRNRERLSNRLVEIALDVGGLAEDPGFVQLLAEVATFPGFVLNSVLSNRIVFFLRSSDWESADAAFRLACSRDPHHVKPTESNGEADLSS